MKSILIPTDFSVCARNAEKAGIALAERFSAKLFFLHQLAPGDPEEVRQSEVNAQILLEEVRKKYSGLDIEYQISQGKLVETILNFQETKGIDFIVMGSHGASGKNEYFMGSNTQKVVRTVHCPVLVVKEPIEKVQFDKVVFASGFTQEERGPFLRFKQIVKHFLPEIHLVAIHTSSLFDPPYIVSKGAMDDFKELCAPLKCETHVFRDFSIDMGIRTFADKVGAQLIGISNRERHPLKRILVGSNVEALVNHSSLPVLCIDYPDPQKKES